MSNNIIDKIQLSGITYDIGGQGGSGVSVVEVTQAEYDALPTSAKTDTSKMYVITDAEPFDVSNYYTKDETSGATELATAFAATQPKLSAGTNITIDANNVISAEGGGSITIDPSLDSGSTNPVANSAITNTLYTAANANGDGNGYVGSIEAKNDSTYLDRLIWGFTATRYKRPLGGSNSNNSQNVSFFCSSINGVRTVSNNYQNVGHFSLVETSAITTSLTSSSTDAQVPSAKAVYDIVGDIETLLSQI